MKYPWIASLALVALTVFAGLTTYVCLRHPARNDQDALAWIRVEFHPGAERMARIEQLHEAYHGVCEQHCQNIRDAREKLAALQVAQAPASEIQDLQTELTRLDAKCRRDLTAHVHQIADILGGEAGQRYLDLVLPRIATFDHEAAPDLLLQHEHHHHGAESGS